jgi:SAM-dependent methyltransferase
MEKVYSSPYNLIERDEKKEALLLDCGINNGKYSSILGEILNSKEVVGLEVNFELAYQARKQHVCVIVTDLNTYFPMMDDSFDVITSFNLLEHLIETQRYLSEVFRVLKPGGYAIINTPNLASWHNIAALIMGYQPFSGPNIYSMAESDFNLIRTIHRRAHNLPLDIDINTSEDMERYRHVVVVAYKSLISALLQTGFQIDESFGYGYYPFPPFLANFFSRFNPSHSAHIVIKARKPIYA